MRVQRADLAMENGKTAYYDSAATLSDAANVGPALIIEVENFDEALEVVATLDRSRAQRRKERKQPEPAQEDKPRTDEPNPEPKDVHPASKAGTGK